MGLEQFDMVRKASTKLKIALDCDVPAEDFDELSKLNGNKGILFEKKQAGQLYDVVIGTGKIIASTVYKIDTAKYTTDKIVNLCNQIASNNVYAVHVTQSIKPNAWYTKLVGRDIFVYRDHNDFLTEPMSGKKLWQVDVKKNEQKYINEMYKLKKVDVNSSKDMLNCIQQIARLANIFIDFAIYAECYNENSTNTVVPFYTKDASLAYKAMNYLREQPCSELLVIDLVDEADTAAYASIDAGQRYGLNDAGEYIFLGTLKMKMNVTIKSKALKGFEGSIVYGLTSCTDDGTIDDFNMLDHYSRASDFSRELSLLFENLVTMSNSYPKQTLMDIWLEAEKG